jgi:hypothetical protein
MHPQRKSNFDESKQNFLKNRSLTGIGQQNSARNHAIPNTPKKTPEIARPKLNFTEKFMTSPRLRENPEDSRKIESSTFKFAPTKNFFLKDNFFDDKRIIRVDEPVKFKIPRKGTITIFEKKVARVESHSSASIQEMEDRNPNSILQNFPLGSGRNSYRNGPLSFDTNRSKGVAEGPSVKRVQDYSNMFENKNLASSSNLSNGSIYRDTDPKPKVYNSGAFDFRYHKTGRGARGDHCNNLEDRGLDPAVYYARGKKMKKYVRQRLQEAQDLKMSRGGLFGSQSKRIFIQDQVGT